MESVWQLWLPPQRLLAVVLVMMFTGHVTAASSCAAVLPRLRCPGFSCPRE